MDYALAPGGQAPPVETVIVALPSEHGPSAPRAMAVVAARAAIANAIADGTGRRFTELAITSETIGRALRTAGSGR